MSATHPTIDPSHPLALGRARLERIKDRTHSFIAAQLRGEALLGGEDAHDVVQEVILSLLKKPVDYTENWERLAMTIAKARLKDAYGRARRGRKHHDDYEAQRDPNRDPDAINVLPLGSPAADNGLDQLTVAGRLNWGRRPRPSCGGGRAPSGVVGTRSAGSERTRTHRLYRNPPQEN